MNDNRDSNRIVFCEGKASSFDMLFWNRIIVSNVLDGRKYRCEIVPMGGKFGGSFSDGYAVASKNKNTLIIRDRDLDFEPDDARLEKLRTNRIFATACTTIESYFISGDLLRTYLTQHHTTYAAMDHDSVLKKTLDSLRDYQAVRWALQKVRERAQQGAVELGMTREGSTQILLPNRLTDEDGKLPPNLSVEQCAIDAKKRVEAFRAVFQTIETNELEGHIDRFRNEFNGEQFWQRGFLRWFHGKDLLKAWLKAYPFIDHKAYCNWAAQTFDWTQFPDLLELQRICQSDELL